MGFKKVTIPKEECSTAQTFHKVEAAQEPTCVPLQLFHPAPVQGDSCTGGGGPGEQGPPGKDGVPKDISVNGALLPRKNTLDLSEGDGINLIASAPNPNTNSVLVELEDSGVTPNTYGAQDTVPVVTVDAKGRVTSVTDTPILIGDANITGVSGSKVSGAVANATTAVNFSGSLAGDVTGTQGATVVDKIEGNSVNTGALGIGDQGKLFTWTGSDWVAAAPVVPTATQITITPTDSNNAAGTWQGLIPSGTMTLKQAIDRTGTYLGWGRLFLPQAQDSGGTPTSTPSSAGSNKLENILDVLYWRGQPVAVVPATPNITVYTDATGAIQYGRLPFAAFTQLSARSVVGNTANATGTAANISSSAARQALMSNAANTAIGFRVIVLDDLPNAPASTILGNVTTISAVRTDVPLANLISARNALYTDYLTLVKNYTSHIFTSTARVSVDNTVAETSIFPSAPNLIGSRTIPALLIVPAPGVAFQVRLAGRFITPVGASTLRIRVKLESTAGTLVIADSTPFFMYNGLNNLFEGVITLNARAVSGLNGTFAQGMIRYADSSGQYVVHGIEIPFVSGLTVDWTLAQTINITAEWGAVGHTMHVDQLEISSIMQ